MPPLWWFPAMVMLVLVVLLEFGVIKFKFLERVNKRLQKKGIGFDSWDRVEFDWSHYSTLRRTGLSHKDTIHELDRLWEQNSSGR